ncbi:MAG: hypothetical protein JXA43_00035 [Candidatus Diapherotrites archaeon]|nr:hypothetical protein [Candidatus Diapherotrites archaeon]
MVRQLVTGCGAAAWAARRARVDYVPNFPITPQTELIDGIAQWVADGEWDVEFETMDSEHSVMSAAVGGAAAGGRVFTGSGSQGLLLMHEVMYIASGLRLPIVMATMSRGISAPITLWTDHTDFLDNLSTGWIMFHAQNNQEIFDSVLQAYKIAENENVLLPVMVNMDGYILSYTVEPADIASQEAVDKFLPRYNPKHAYFDPKKPPLIQGSSVLGDYYTVFRSQQHKAMSNALEVSKQVFKDFNKQFGRKYDVFETYKIEDADYVLLVQGSMGTITHEAIDRMRAKGKKVGMLRMRMIRPFPEAEFSKVLKNAKGVAVIDRNLAPGRGGIMFPEIKSALYEYDVDPIVSNFIVGLGGNNQTVKKIMQIEEKLEQDVKKGKGSVDWNDLEPGTDAYSILSKYKK